MSIQISNPDSQPQVSFDHVFLVRLRVEQIMSTDHAKMPIFKVLVEYRLFGLNGTQRVFHPEIKEIVIQDFLAEAAHSSDLLPVFPTLESAIAVLVARDIGSQTIRT